MHRDLDRAEDFFALLANRSSVRSFDTTKGVPVEDERRIVETAQRAPTSFNLQTYSFVSVKDGQKRRRAAELASKQWFICDAGVFFVVCADLNKMKVAVESVGYDFFQSRFLESFLMASVDAAIAGTAAALAAESMGYGTCMIGGVRNYVDEMVNLLGLPRMVFPLFGLCVGHPLKKNPPKRRLPLSGVLFEDSYDCRAMEGAIREYDAEMSRSGIYRGREFPLEDVRGPGVEGASAREYGWMEHSARRISTRDPEKTRHRLRKDLDEQGFSFS